MPQRNVATNFTFEQQRNEINLLASDFWTQKGTVDTAASTYLKHDGSNNFTGANLAVPSAFTINSNSGGGTVTIAGNLDVTGTTTTVSSANLEVTDKNILIAKGSTSDSQADGAGITIDSATDITWNFVDANDAWVSSIGVESTTFLKATTFLEAARGQFTGATTPSAGSGVEVNAPDANTGQIIAYNRGTTAYNELRVKGTSVGVYTGTTNALVGTFNSTGLTMEASKGITCPGNLDVDGSSTFGANGSITSGANFSLNGNALTVTGTSTVVAEFKKAGNPTIQCTDTTNNTDLQLRANADGGLVRTATNHPLILGTNQQTRLTITSEGYLKLAGTIANSNNKLGRFLMPSHDSGEEDVMYMQFQQEDTYNQLEFGGGSGSYNAATQIIFRTAAIDTVTGVERLRIASDGTISKYHNATDISAAFGGSGQVNGVTALPSMAGTPFVVAKDTGSGRSATFAGNVLHEAAVTVRGYVGIGADSYTGYTFPTPTGIQNNVKLLQIDGGDGAELILGNSLSPNVATNHVGAIAFKNIDDSASVAPNYAGIRCNCVDTVGNMNLKFYAGNTAFEADTPHMLIDSLGKTLFNPHSSGETNADTVVTIRGWAADTNTTVNEDFKNAPLKIRKTISATALNGGFIDCWDDGIHAIGLAMNYGGSSGANAGYHLVFGVNNDTNDRPTEKFRISGDGTISDSKGSLRRLPQNNQSGGYNLLAADAGKHINTTGDIGLYTGQFVVGDAVTIFNKGTAAINIGLGGGVTMYQAGTSNVGNRGLDAKGICTILCTEQGSGTNTFVISGAGLT